MRTFLKGTSTLGKRLYTLEVSILGGRMTDEFIRDNPSVRRTIEIRGDQTLQHLHGAIFDAFDRSDLHLYEFQFGKGPHDPNADRYVLPDEFEDPILGQTPPAGDLTKTTIDSLNLTTERTFGYWFDFGDDWHHRIDVVAIGEAEPKTRYPRVVARVGASPPQYPDWEDDDEDDDERWDEDEEFDDEEE